MSYVEDDNGAVVSETCLYHCAPGLPAPCEGGDCECGCHRSSEPWVDPELSNPFPHTCPPVDRCYACAYEPHRRDMAAERARELDDRPDATLHSIARDLEHEARPDVAALTAERFGRRRGAA